MLEFVVGMALFSPFFLLPIVLGQYFKNASVDVVRN